MPKEDPITVTARIIEALPNTQFRAELESGQTVLAYCAGKIRKNYIRIMPGDTVTIELSPYDLTRGRIVYRDK